MHNVDHIWDALRSRVESTHGGVELARDTNGDAVAFAYGGWEALRKAGLIKRDSYDETLVCKRLDIGIVFSDQYELVYPGDSEYVTGAEEPTVYSTESMYIWDVPEAEVISNNHEAYLIFTHDADTEDILDGLRYLFGDDNPAQSINSLLLAGHFRWSGRAETMMLPCDRDGFVDVSELPDGTVVIPDPSPTPNFYYGDPERQVFVVDLSYSDTSPPLTY